MYKLIIKRLMDICISILLLPIILCIVAVAAVLIKIEDNGSIFYISKRYGKNMRPFNMYKLRTMKMDAPDIRNADGTTFNSEDDERLTRVGKILRKTSIDELPQVLNVLVGDMSWVGPRPSPMGNEDTYDEYIRSKFNVRPGITGYNQALKRNSASLQERYDNDVYYVENISFKLDFKIVLLTIVNVFANSNIYSN